jgi:transcriptional regulator
MYTPSAFREDRLDVLREAIARHPLATLISTAGKDIQASHVPLVYVQTGGTAVLRGHVARANPHCRPTEANREGLAVFTGPQHYISPQWYPSKRDHGKVVPTWNYIAVHVRGRLTFRTDAEWLWQMLEVLTNEQEGPLGTGWRITDAPKDFIDEQLAAIVGVELTVETIEGKWKLSQNRTAIDREGVIAGLESVGSELAREMARVMRGERMS